MVAYQMFASPHFNRAKSISLALLNDYVVIKAGDNPRQMLDIHFNQYGN